MYMHCTHILNSKFGLCIDGRFVWWRTIIRFDYIDVHLTTIAIVFLIIQTSHVKYLASELKMHALWQNVTAWPACDLCMVCKLIQFFLSFTRIYEIMSVEGKRDSFMESNWFETHMIMIISNNKIQSKYMVL